jgi:hypothetical protein
MQHQLLKEKTMCIFNRPNRVANRVTDPDPFVPSILSSSLIWWDDFNNIFSNVKVYCDLNPNELLNLTCDQGDEVDYIGSYIASTKFIDPMIGQEGADFLDPNEGDNYLVNVEKSANNSNPISNSNIISWIKLLFDIRGTFNGDFKIANDASSLLAIDFVAGNDSKNFSTFIYNYLKVVKVDTQNTEWSKFANHVINELLPRPGKNAAKSEYWYPSTNHSGYWNQLQSLMSYVINLRSKFEDRTLLNPKEVPESSTIKSFYQRGLRAMNLIRHLLYIVLFLKTAIGNITHRASTISGGDNGAKTLLNQAFRLVPYSKKFSLLTGLLTMDRQTLSLKSL